MKNWLKRQQDTPTMETVHGNYLNYLIPEDLVEKIFLPLKE
jgi:hypothetical protein